VKFKDQPIDAALEGWKQLCSLLAIACANSEGNTEYRQPGDFELLIQEKQPPRALRLEYSPDFKKLRYNTGISGWQELNVVKRPQKPVVFETPYRQRERSSARIVPARRLSRAGLPSTPSHPKRAPEARTAPNLGN